MQEAPQTMCESEFGNRIALHSSGRFGGDARAFRQIYRKAVGQIVLALES